MSNQDCICDCYTTEQHDLLHREGVHIHHRRFFSLDLFINDAVGEFKFDLHVVIVMDKHGKAVMKHTGIFKKPSRAIAHARHLARTIQTNIVSAPQALIAKYEPTPLFAPKPNDRHLFKPETLQ